MYTIKNYNHETQTATTNAFEAAKNRAIECTKKGSVALVYDEEKLIGIGENGNYHDLSDGEHKK